MKELKENKGSITVLAVTGMIFVIVVLSIIFIAISNKKLLKQKISSKLKQTTI